MVCLLVLLEAWPGFARLHFHQFLVKAASQDDKFWLQSTQKEDPTDWEAFGFEVIEAGFEFNVILSPVAGELLRRA